MTLFIAFIPVDVCCKCCYRILMCLAVAWYSNLAKTCVIDRILPYYLPKIWKLLSSTTIWPPIILDNDSLLGAIVLCCHRMPCGVMTFFPSLGCQVSDTCVKLKSVRFVFCLTYFWKLPTPCANNTCCFWEVMPQSQAREILQESVARNYWDTQCAINHGGEGIFIFQGYAWFSVNKKFGHCSRI